MKKRAIVGVALTCVAASAAAVLLASTSPLDRQVPRKRTAQSSLSISPDAGRVAGPLGQALPSAAGACDYEDLSARTGSPQATSALPCPPADMQANPERCGEWLLALPDAELARLVLTPELDRMVGGVVEGLRRAGGPDSDAYAAMSAFLERMNARILSVQGK